MFGWQAAGRGKVKRVEKAGGGKRLQKSKADA
jgi:hypothetical protein